MASGDIFVDDLDTLTKHDWDETGVVIIIIPATRPAGVDNGSSVSYEAVVPKANDLEDRQESDEMHGPVYQEN